MKVQRIQIAKHHYVWLVLGDNYLPIEPIEVFIRYLHYTEKSPQTILSYANHLKLFWEYLDASQKDWRKLTLSDFARFVHWLRSFDNVICLKNGSQPQRSERTVNSILSAVASFYRHHNQLGNTDIKLTGVDYSSNHRHKSLLYHIFKYKPTFKRVISLKPIKTRPKTLKSLEVKQCLDACQNQRDRFLIQLLYESGIRIGQALALKHEDIKSWDNEIEVIFRANNENLARNKSRRPNIIHVSQALMQLYTDYLQCYPELVAHCDYVFVNFQTKQALTYGAVRKLFERLSKKMGLNITPHLFRHTHATELIQQGWDMAWVQKRLGHTHIQTTIDTYTHLDQHDLKKAFQAYQQKKKQGDCL